MKHVRFCTLLCSIATLFIGCDSQADNIDQKSSLSLNHHELTLQPGESQTLEVSLQPSSSEPVIWSSSDTKVATVFYGKISAQNLGSTIIKVSVGELTDSCIVTVSLNDYDLVWSDEFNDTTLNLNSWNIETGGNGWGNQEKQYYTGRSENLRVSDGKLYIEALKEQYESNSYTSARITTKNKHDFAYGKIEASIKLPKGQGTWPAFWMLGYGSWPTCGEIDIMEHVGSDPTMISHAVHTYKRNGMNGQNWAKRINKEHVEDEFHTYGIEWEKAISNGDDYIKFYVDGELTATLWESHGVDNKSEWPFNDQFYIILNVAIGGTMGGAIDDAMFDQPVVMEVDWVRVYQRQ